MGRVERWHYGFPCFPYIVISTAQSRLCEGTSARGGNESPEPPYTENGPQNALRDIPEEDIPDLKTNFTSSDPDDENEDDDLD